MDAGCTLQELASHTGSVLQGDGQLLIRAVVPLESARHGELSFISNPKYRTFLHTTQASALILPPALAAEYTGHCLINPNPYLAYAKAVALLNPMKQPAAGIHPTAVVDATVRVHPTCHIAAHAVVEAGAELAAHVVIGAGCVVGQGCRIGEGTRLYPNVTLYADTQIGQRCIIHAGAVLGADGFGFAPDAGRWHKIPQVGNVVVGDDVEIGANTCIDRAALGSTVLGNGVKLDNLIQIGHNAQVGEHTAMAAGVAVAGSTKIGRHCQVGGMSAIAGHLQIADHVTITGTSMVSHNINKAGVYSSGTTAVENALWRKNAARFHQLDSLARRVQDLERQLAALKEQGSS